MGWTATDGRLSVTVPTARPPGRTRSTVTGTNQGRTVSTTVAGQRRGRRLPTAQAAVPRARINADDRLDDARRPVRITWPAATDPSSAIAGYEVESSVDGGAWGHAVDVGARPSASTTLVQLATRPTGSASAPSTRPGTGARGSRGAT